MIINKQDTNGVKPLLATGELGYDNYPAGGDVGRVYVGTGTKNVALANKSEVAVAVGTIEDFPINPGIGDTVIVKDLNRGGTFIYDATQSAVNNGGTVFDGWVRQYSGAVNVKWFGAVGDGITDDTVAIQNALDLGYAVAVPEGVFLVDNISIQQPTVLKGQGHSKTIFKAIDSKTSGAIMSLATTSNAYYCIFSDFTIEGRFYEESSNATSIIGLKIGSSISIISTESIFENIQIRKCHTGLNIIYSWSNSFKGITISNCFTGAILAPQVNNVSFIGFHTINCKKHLEISNCEGVSFEAPLFQNSPLSAEESAPISLFQSNVNMNNPYFEGIETNILISVGSMAESVTAPSSLIITGGELNSSTGNILKSRYAVVNITNLRESASNAVVIGGDCAFSTTNFDSAGGTRSNSSLKRLASTAIEQNKLLYSLPIDNSEFLASVYGGSLTTAPNPDNSMEVRTNIANTGLLLPTPLLEIGKIYTLVYRIKKTTENYVFLLVNRAISIPVSKDSFETLYVTFMANSANQPLIIFPSTIPVNIQQLDLYEGCVIGTDNGYQDSLKKYGSVAPTTGAWKKNQIVYDKNPTASGFIGWVCTVAGTPGTWKTFGAISA